MFLDPTKVNEMMQRYMGSSMGNSAFGGNIQRPVEMPEMDRMSMISSPMQQAPMVQASNMQQAPVPSFTQSMRSPMQSMQPMQPLQPMQPIQQMQPQMPSMEPGSFREKMGGNTGFTGGLNLNRDSLMDSSMSGQNQGMGRLSGMNWGRFVGR